MKQHPPAGEVTHRSCCSGRPFTERTAFSPTRKVKYTGEDIHNYHVCIQKLHGSGSLSISNISQNKGSSGSDENGSHTDLNIALKQEISCFLHMPSNSQSQCLSHELSVSSLPFFPAIGKTPSCINAGTVPISFSRGGFCCESAKCDYRISSRYLQGFKSASSATPPGYGRRQA